MLGIEVPRLKLASILVLALLTAGQLALHHHSLVPEAGAAGLLCGVCAFSSDGAIAAEPTVEPLAFISDFVPPAEWPVLSAVRLSFTTRGPPQA